MIGVSMQGRPPSPFLWGRIREEVKQYTHKQSMHAQTPQCMQAQLGLEPSQAISRWPELRRLRWSNGKGPGSLACRLLATLGNP